MDDFYMTSQVIDYQYLAGNLIPPVIMGDWQSIYYSYP